MDKYAVRLAVAVDMLQDDALVDFSDWESEEIKLYYFDDVRRLMAVLSPVAPQVVNDASSLAIAAGSTRDALESALQDRRNKQQEVNNARRRVQLLEEELRQKQLGVKTKLRQAKSDLTRAEREFARQQAAMNAAKKAKADAQFEEQKAQAAYDRTKADHDALDPTDPQKETARRTMESARATLT